MLTNALWRVVVALVAGACAYGCSDEPTPKTMTGNGAGEGGACQPRSCTDADVRCGEVEDGCGHVLTCGDACVGAGGQGGAGPVGSAGSCDENVVATEIRNGRRAHSAGFEAGDDKYLELFDVPCGDALTCVEECDQRGGLKAMCIASECLPASESTKSCVPPPIWGSLESIQAEDQSILDMSQIVLVNSSYRDVLVVDDFALDVPAAATIRGITVQVRRSGDASVVDDSVRLVKAGEVVGSEHGTPEAWSDDPEWISYGGEADTWSEDWTAADLNAADFGVGLSAQYTEGAGNTRAYVDQVRVTVSYSDCPK